MIAPYTIQAWLFDEAAGRFDIDLGESGIQYHHLNDLRAAGNIDLNYSIDAGKDASRQAVAKMYQQPTDRVVITHGSQEALYLCYRSVLRTGDHVITFAPGWQQSWEVPRAIGCEVSILPLDLRHDRPLIDIETVQAAIMPQTRMLVINTPNNPTGRTLAPEHIQALVTLCESKGILLLCDEEYLTDPTRSIVHLSEQAACVNSLSKTYGLPGLRFGWFVGPAAVAKAMINYKRYVTVSNSSLCEHLALQALAEQTRYVQAYDEAVYTGREQLLAWLQLHPRLDLVNFHDTPFAYVRTPFTDTLGFCRRLLERSRVLVMPGEVFQGEAALRISIARPRSILQAGLQHLSAVLEEHGC